VTMKLTQLTLPAFRQVTTGFIR